MLVTVGQESDHPLLEGTGRHPWLNLFGDVGRRDSLPLQADWSRSSGRHWPDNPRSLRSVPTGDVLQLYRQVSRPQQLGRLLRRELTAELHRRAWCAIPRAAPPALKLGGLTRFMDQSRTPEHSRR